MIYTTSKIRINNHQATIDKTIILYRGDRNVEIQFEILENGYREYRVEGTNVISNLNASYGQLIVQKPDHTHIFSGIVPTQDGKVIFTIPRELIDETIEVGQYTFQIRLYNEDQTSRVTLPPVVGGIDIVEPIAIDDSFVDTSMVGYSIAKTDSDDEENKRFDENGNYIKTYWEHGDIITAGKLNKVEDSLEAINANDIQNHIDVNEKIDALVESIDAAEYITETELNAKGYLTEHQDISGKADKTELPTKTSQLTNDSGFLNQIPAEYVTETELNAKGYLTEHQDISGKADKTELPTKTSQLTNDSGFLNQIPAEYVTETELNAKGYLTEHQDISGLATKEYVDNVITNLNIDIDYDSLLAFDTNEIITTTNYVDSNNNIILDDDLPAGIYTLKYEFKDGTYTDIKNFIIKNESSGAVMNLLEEGEIHLNKTFDGNSVSLKDFLGVVTIALPINFDGKTQCTLNIQNSPRGLMTYKDYNMLVFTDVDMTTMSYVNGSVHLGYMNEGCWTVSDDGKSLGVCVFTPPANKQLMYLSLMIKYTGDDLTITEADFGDLNITLVIEGGSN